ncbi:MAG: hypothetical protein KDI33_15260 [Halioglobus sp.]|nr:hypothetical protein [Halioglobus sp.]
MKTPLFILATILVTPALCGAAESEPVTPAEAGEEPLNWVDESHAYATDNVQALTEWMDNFFGDPNYELEKAESLVRVLWRNEFDQSDGYNTKVRLRGKLQLPKISKRLNLFFGGEDGDQLSNDEVKSEDNAGLLYTIDQRQRSRVDLTMGFSSRGFRPGVRYRNQGPLYENSSYRFTQQVEHKDGKGFFSTGELNLDAALSATNLLRFSNELVYGENTEGTEWQSTLVLYQRRSVHKKDPRVFSYFGSVNGASDPSYVKNYRLGVQFRRQLYRPYLFVELQPSYNYLKRSADDRRRGSWRVELNFEIALERDLRRRPLLKETED